MKPGIYRGVAAEGEQKENKREDCNGPFPLSFARCYSDFLFTKFSSSEHRRARAMTLLHACRGRLGIADFFAILRDHGDISPGNFRPDQGLIQSQICNHAGWGPIRISQTTGSLVSRLTPAAERYRVRDTACTSFLAVRI